MTSEIAADIYNEDCIEGMPRHIADDSVHLTVTSIPFEELFTYSGKLADVGNNGSTIDIRKGRFGLNLRFVIEQLHRVTSPGCNVAIHIQQLLSYKNQHGYMGRRDFRATVIDLFIADGGGIALAVPDPETGAVDPIVPGNPLYRGPGFHFIGEAAIPKDPQAMAQRLSLHSLQFKTGHTRTSTNWAMAPNDYVLIFQKPGEPSSPVRPLVYHRQMKPKRRQDFYDGIGRKDVLAYAEHLQRWGQHNEAINPTGWIGADDWIKWASGVWDDIDEFDILDGARSRRALSELKETEEEKHVCPLSLEIIRRLVLIYSNPIDIQPDVLVLDPFMGIGSTAHECVMLRRNSVGFELKESYHRNAILNIQRARDKAHQNTREQAPLFNREPAEVTA